MRALVWLLRIGRKLRGRPRPARVTQDAELARERILQAQCPVCYDVAANSPKTTTACAHDFCLACLLKHIHHGGLHCPMCRTPLAHCTAKWRDGITFKTNSLDVQLRVHRARHGGPRSRSRATATAYCHLPSIESDGGRTAHSQFALSRAVRRVAPTQINVRATARRRESRAPRHRLAHDDPAPFRRRASFI
jgi:hypothetical protein